MSNDKRKSRNMEVTEQGSYDTRGKEHYMIPVSFPLYK